MSMRRVPLHGNERIRFSSTVASCRSAGSKAGFGLGVNFLTTWAALERCSRDRCSVAGADLEPTLRLDYVSIEKHPFTRDDLRTILGLSVMEAPVFLQPDLKRLVTRLLAAWPPIIHGFHALELDDRVTLTLVFEDIADAMPQMAGRFDAIYLDGFAPDRNPAMWAAPILAKLAAVAAPGARVSSGCVASSVRVALADAGFDVEQHPGSDSEPGCLAAHWPGSHVPAASVNRALPAAGTSIIGGASAVSSGMPTGAVVIGAGIAGASVARQLARRGVQVMVLERDVAASGGSGNPVGVVRPEPGGASNPTSALTAAGVTWLMRWVAHHGQSVPHDWCGVMRIARDERKRKKMATQAAATDPAWLQAVDIDHAARLCGTLPAETGFHLPQAGWIVPPALVAALLDHPRVTLRSRCEVTALHRDGDAWQLALADGSHLRVPVVVLTTAFDPGLGSTRLAMGRARGQLSMLPVRDGRDLNMVVCRDGYITPAINGMHVVGATVQHDDEEAASRRSDDGQNFERLQRLLPDFVAHADELQSGRVGWRSTTPDRLPLVGKLEEGLYASLGHGARGITCAPLCGEFLAAMMCDAPLPLGAEWIARLDPLRRAVKPEESGTS